MKKKLLFLFLFCIIFSPTLSFSKEFQKEYDTKIEPKLDTLRKNNRDLANIVKDYTRVFFNSKSITYEEMAAYQKILKEIHGSRLIIYYETELLVRNGGLCDDMYILATYKQSKERYNTQKRNIVNHHVDGIKSVYGEIKNIAVLHLIDKAIKKIDSSLELLDTCYDIFRSVLPEGELIQVTPEGDIIHHKLD